jgi:hypothetical protein
MHADEPFESRGPEELVKGRGLLVATVLLLLPCVFGFAWVIAAWVRRGTSLWGVFAFLPFLAMPAFVYLLYRIRPAGPPRVVVDPVSRNVLFVHCWQPRTFWPQRRLPEKVCPFDDIHGVHGFQYRGESMTIVTADGKVLLDPRWSDYRRLVAALREASRGNPRSPLLERPVVMFLFLLVVGFASALLAIAAIVALT